MIILGTRCGSVIRGLLGLAVCAVALSAIPSVARADTSMQLTGVGDQATLGNVYVDPYTATVGTNTNVPVICDDWSDNSYLGEQWTAKVANASTVGTVGSPMFGNNQTLYNEVTYLAAQLMSNSTNPTNQTEYSFAIWALTYGANGTPAATPDPLSYLAANLSGGKSNAEYIATVADLNYAKTYEANYNSTGWEILTPIPGTSVPSSDGTPQEFLVKTPEPSTLLMLILGLGGLLGLAWRQRRSASPLA